MVVGSVMMLAAISVVLVAVSVVLMAVSVVLMTVSVLLLAISMVLTVACIDRQITRLKRLAFEINYRHDGTEDSGGSNNSCCNSSSGSGFDLYSSTQIKTRNKLMRLLRTTVMARVMALLSLGRLQVLRLLGVRCDEENSQKEHHLNRIKQELTMLLTHNFN